ncbi:hypothetical protein M758_12G133700 [Ceratodon purpureus]|nr:hypothetical protein M758_12G133700 [Ceratodon purpureus]
MDLIMASFFYFLFFEAMTSILKKWAQKRDSQFRNHLEMLHMLHMSRLEYTRSYEQPWRGVPDAAGVPGVIEIRVLDGFTDTVYTLDMHSTDPVAVLKEEIGRGMNIQCPYSLHIEFNGKVLNDCSKTLDACKIRSGSTLRVIKLRPDMCIYVRAPELRRNFSLEVGSNYSIYDIKNMISKELGLEYPQNKGAEWNKDTIPGPHRQRLFCLGKELEDFRTLATSEIENDSTLYLKILKDLKEISKPRDPDRQFHILEGQHWRMARMDFNTQSGATLNVSAGLKGAGKPRKKITLKLPGAKGPEVSLIMDHITASFINSIANSMRTVRRIGHLRLSSNALSRPEGDPAGIIFAYIPGDPARLEGPSLERYMPRTKDRSLLVFLYNFGTNCLHGMFKVWSDDWNIGHPQIRMELSGSGSSLQYKKIPPEIIRTIDGTGTVLRVLLSSNVTQHFKGLCEREAQTSEETLKVYHSELQRINAAWERPGWAMAEKCHDNLYCPCKGLENFRSLCPCIFEKECLVERAKGHQDHAFVLRKECDGLDESCRLCKLADLSQKIADASNKQASWRIFDSVNNKYKDQTHRTMDLHNQPVHQAEEITRYYLDKFSRNYYVDKFTIITGRGKNSVSGRCIIKEAVLSIVDKHPFVKLDSSDNEGRVVITFI